MLHLEREKLVRFEFNLVRFENFYIFEIIENFKEAIDSGHKISTVSSFDKRTNKTYTRYLIQICSKDFVKNLINFGVTNRKSYICNFPNLKKKYYPDFLRGLFDGDGSTSRKSKNNIRIKFIATKEIILEIHRFFKDNYDIEPHPIYSVSDNMNVYNTHYFKDAQKVLSILYKNSNEKNRLTRKFLIYENKS